MNKKFFGKINLISLLILALVPLVIVLGIWLGKVSQAPSQPEAFGPKLQAVIDSALAKAPDAAWVTILTNNEMNIAYVPGEKAFVVTTLHPLEEESVKNGVREYLTGLGVSDFSNLKITYRTKPVI